jgi:hypothetical protein
MSSCGGKGLKPLVFVDWYVFADWYVFVDWCDPQDRSFGCFGKGCNLRI